MINKSAERNVRRTTPCLVRVNSSDRSAWFSSSSRVDDRHVLLISFSSSDALRHLHRRSHHGEHHRFSQRRIEYHYIDGRDNLQFASTATRDHSDHLPPKHLTVDRRPNLERARIVRTSDVPTGGHNQNDEVLIRDTIVQHISEDEKSTSSEEVIFEEWSEEFRCRRTEEYDHDTYRLLRTTIDETSERVKSDVIKEEYREKNERIKGHKSYDVVKEVYRRVPAHTVDPTTTTVVSTNRPFAGPST